MRHAAALGAGDDCEFLLVGQLGGGDNGADADRVNSDGLFGKDVFAGLDGGF